MRCRKIAFPTIEEGLESELSGHFGKCTIFTTISINKESNEVQKMETIANPSHQHGGCMHLVMMLKNNDVTDVVLRGIGHRPLMGFQKVGIQAYSGVEGSINKNLELLKENKLEILAQSTCNHH